MNQDEAKRAAGRAAIEYVTPGTVVGVGTGSTAAYFIEALGEMPEPVAAAVSSSERSTAALRALGIEVLDPNEVAAVDVYVDGADEIDPHGYLIKGGGGALTREKIVAALSPRFVCIADASKNVPVLGAFPLPIEIIGMAEAAITRRLTAGVLGSSGRAVLRRHADGAVYLTDNGHPVLDVYGLQITDPLAVEDEISIWPGVVTVGVFAHQKASVALLGSADGVTTIRY